MKTGSGSREGNRGRDGVEQAAAEIRNRLLRSDPDTRRQWQFLRTRLEALPAGEPGLEPASDRGGLRSIRAWILRPALAVAALLIIFVAGRLWIGSRSPVQEYATAGGERSTVTLPDSSEVILNHRSRIQVEGGGASREVDLQGEAFFRVRKNGTPFVVNTAAGRVEVLGTEFNVRVRENRFEVAVVSGTVRVSAFGTRSRTTVLPAGTMIGVEKGELLPRDPEPLPFADYPGWLHRRLQFHRASVLAVCREIEGMYDVAIRIDARQCSTETISGSLDSRNAESALATVAQLTRTRIRHEANGYILY